jgi:hypothetical protein
MLVKSGYSRSNEKKNVRVMTLAEAKALHYGDHVLILDQNGNFREVKVNGAPKIWKTRPYDCDVPCKYGMYEYFTIHFRESTPVTDLIVEI